MTNSGNPYRLARQVACKRVSWLWGLPDAENLQWSAMVRIWFSDICQTCSCFCVFLAGDSRGLIGVEWRMIFDGSLMEQHYHDMITKSCRKGPRQPETQSSLDRRWNMYLGWSSLCPKTYQVVPGTRRGGSFEKWTWLIGIHGELERSELKWNEMHELTWINWNEWLEMKELKRMNWNAWIETNELKRMNCHERIEMNEMK